MACRSLSSHYPISNESLHAGSATSNARPLANPEILGWSLSVSVHLCKPVMLHSPGLAVDLHVSAIFCSGYQWLRGRHSLFIGVTVPEDFLPFHTVDLLAFLIFIYYTTPHF